MSGLTDEEKKILPEDTMGSRRTFKNSKGDQLFCSIVLAGRDVTSIHRPELCLTGQGWGLGNLQVEQIPTPAVKGGVLSVSRLDATRDVRLPDGRVGRANSIFLYWFIGKGRGDPVPLAAHLLDGQGPSTAQHQPPLGLCFDSHTRHEGIDGRLAKSGDETMKIVAGFVHDDLSHFGCKLTRVVG